jgi:hypothetical protein
VEPTGLAFGVAGLSPWLSHQGAAGWRICCGSKGSQDRSLPTRPNRIPVAQRIEQRITNPQAAGLNPAGDASLRRGCSRARSDLTPIAPVAVASTTKAERTERPECAGALACQVSIVSHGDTRGHIPVSAPRWCRRALAAPPLWPKASDCRSEDRGFNSRTPRQFFRLVSSAVEQCPHKATVGRSIRSPDTSSVLLTVIGKPRKPKSFGIRVRISGSTPGQATLTGKAYLVRLKRTASAFESQASHHAPVAQRNQSTRLLPALMRVRILPGAPN